MNSQCLNMHELIQDKLHYSVGGISLQQYCQYSIESSAFLDQWVSVYHFPLLYTALWCLLCKHDIRFTASVDQHRLFEKAWRNLKKVFTCTINWKDLTVIWARLNPINTIAWLRSSLECIEKCADCCVSMFFWFFFLCQCALHQKRHACIFTDNQERSPTDFINPWNSCLSQQRSLSPEMEGWSALPSGSHHEELADGGCSCSQVGKQVGDWLTFPLDQANLIGEFTAGPFHIGSISDWVATGAKGSHFSPCAVSSLCLFSPSFEPELCSWTCLCYKSTRESKHNLTCI